MSNWTCARCGHSYDPAEGDVRHGIMHHTPWAALPDDWTCPDCHAPKVVFNQTGGSGREGSGWAIA